eukprot:s257_g6.t1
MFSKSQRLPRVEGVSRSFSGQLSTTTSTSGGNRSRPQSAGSSYGHSLRSPHSRPMLQESGFEVAMAEYFTEEQIAEYKVAFDDYDIDGGGSISTSELGTAMRALGACPSDEELWQWINDVDKDGNGELDFQEFLNLMSKMVGRDPYEELSDALKVFDRQGDGHVSVKELKHVLTRMGDVLTSEEVDEWLVSAEVTPEGQINIDLGCCERIMVNKEAGPTVEHRGIPIRAERERLGTLPGAVLWLLEEELRLGDKSTTSVQRNRSVSDVSHPEGSGNSGGFGGRSTVSSCCAIRVMSRQLQAQELKRPPPVHAWNHLEPTSFIPVADRWTTQLSQISIGIKEILEELGCTVYNPNTDNKELYREKADDRWLRTFTENLDRIQERRNGFVLQIQQGMVREKSDMQVAEERMGKQWAVPRMGLFAFAITDTRGGGTTSERDLALAVERSRMQWEAEIKAEVEMVSEWFEPIEGDKELPVNDEGDVHGRARCTFPSGNVYIGDFRNGLKHGKGTWRYKRGNVEIGRRLGSRWIGKSSARCRLLRPEKSLGSSVCRRFRETSRSTIPGQRFRFLFQLELGLSLFMASISRNGDEISCSLPASLVGVLQGMWRDSVARGCRYLCVLEICYNGEKRQLTTKHKPEKYNTYAGNIADLVSREFSFMAMEQMHCSRHYSSLSKAPRRLGACEVYLLMPDGVDNSQSCVIFLGHSKLSSLQWPNCSNLRMRFLNVLPNIVRRVLELRSHDWSVHEGQAVMKEAAAWGLERWDALEGLADKVDAGSRVLESGQQASRSNDKDALREAIQDCHELQLADELIEGWMDELKQKNMSVFNLKSQAKRFQRNAAFSAAVRVLNAAVVPPLRLASLQRALLKALGAF